MRVHAQLTVLPYTKKFFSISIIVWLQFGLNCWGKLKKKRPDKQFPIRRNSIFPLFPISRFLATVSYQTEYPVGTRLYSKPCLPSSLSGFGIEPSISPRSNLALIEYIPLNISLIYRTDKSCINESKINVKVFGSSF